MAIQGNALNVSLTNPLAPELGGTGSSSTIPLDTLVQSSAFNFGLTGGAADAYTVTLDPVPASLTDGLLVSITASFSNTTHTPTLNVNGFGAVPMVDLGGGQLLIDDIVINSTYLLIYSADNNWFTVMNPSASMALTSFVQSNVYNYAADIGVADVYQVNLFPEPGALLAGLIVYMDVAHDNTGASTLQVGSFPAHPIVNVNGDPLSGGEMITGGIAMLIYDAFNNFILLNPVQDLFPLSVANGGTANTIALTDGQLWIGNTGNPPSISNLTAGAGISIQNTAGAITISGTGSGIGWQDVTSSPQAMVADTAYVANTVALSIFTLPTTAAFGTVLNVTGYGAPGWTINQNAGQSIRVGSQTTTTGVAGSVSSTLPSDSIDLVCVVADTVWVSVGAPQGNLTVV